MKRNNKQIKTKTMSWLAYGERHGVSQQTISRWRRAGLVVLADNGHIDVIRSDNLLSGRLRRYRGGIAKGPAGEQGDDGLTLPELPEPPPLGPLPSLGPRVR